MDSGGFRWILMDSVWIPFWMDSGWILMDSGWTLMDADGFCMDSLGFWMDSDGFCMVSDGSWKDSVWILWIPMDSDGF